MSINKKFISFAVITLSSIALAACGNQSSSSSVDTTITVTDMVGDTATFKKNPKKVACVSRTTYDLLIAYGLGDKIDGAYKGTLNNPWVNVIYPAAKDQYSYGYTESSETFLTRGIDLVFAPEKYIADNLKKRGIPALCVSLYGKPTFDNYVTFLSNLVTQIWDDPAVKEKADAWNKKVTGSIGEIKAELAKHEITKKKLFYVRGDKDKGVGYTDSAQSFTEYAYRTLGFDYVGASLSTITPSAEEVCAANPDIFVCGGIYQNKNIAHLHEEPYSNLDAVKNNKIYNIPIGLTAFEQLSAMTPVFFYDQAKKIYPEYFTYDIAAMSKETIKGYFGTELSDEQIGYMLKGLGPTGESLVS
ncbi:MAG: ABC transporter substrate-binding protein [Bacilli bacterium]|jgi:iron complex transport system substrate-binding protein|nr:ABC transporter substrate-binding protein [Bacilli bacterium]